MTVYTNSPASSPEVSAGQDLIFHGRNTGEWRRRAITFVTRALSLLAPTSLYGGMHQSLLTLTERVAYTFLAFPRGRFGDEEDGEAGHRYPSVSGKYDVEANIKQVDIFAVAHDEPDTLVNPGPKD